MAPGQPAVPTSDHDPTSHYERNVLAGGLAQCKTKRQASHQFHFADCTDIFLVPSMHESLNRDGEGLQTTVYWEVLSDSWLLIVGRRVLWDT